MGNGTVFGGVVNIVPQGARGRGVRSFSVTPAGDVVATMTDGTTEPVMVSIPSGGGGITGVSLTDLGGGVIEMTVPDNAGMTVTQISSDVIEVTI